MNIEIPKTQDRKGRNLKKEFKDIFIASLIKLTGEQAQYFVNVAEIMWKKYEECPSVMDPEGWAHAVAKAMGPKKTT